jgi:hypothetical protein
VCFGQGLTDQVTEISATEGLFSQASVRPVLGQCADSQLYGSEAGEEQGHAAGVVAAYGVKHPQSILVVMVAAAQGHVNHGQAVGHGPQLCNRRLQVFGYVNRQPGLGQDFTQDLLPRAVVLDDKPTNNGHF